MADIVWPGWSSLTYSYWFIVDAANRPIYSEPGNYMFVREARPGFWAPLYIGITDNLRQRLCTNHEKWPLALAFGATHVMAHRQPNQWLRETEERDLIGRWNPVCNTQHRTDGGLPAIRNALALLRA
ncbi:hypothetical protein [Reyranella sp.]|uniref:hypothetical protein n=1 Tax=Reyranella sp. TaxID=1929291 RepID=UPI0012117D5B|nr:hypothetical protein [Reyranella sp.]TAJ84625.1 MAG: hypothetical protein EPO50_18245 [Reyranella sp.]